MDLRLAVFVFFVATVNCHTYDLEHPLGNGNKQKFTYSFCSEKCGDALGFGLLDDNAGNTKWPRDKLCIAVPDVPTFRGREYTLSIQLFNEVGWAGVNSGHPAVVFNLVDSANYDYVFIAPHSATWCYGYGYVMGSHLDYRSIKCSPPKAPKGGVWHDLKVHVTGRQTQVFLNKKLLGTFRHHFPNIARGGPGFLNGHKNRVYFRKLDIKPVG